LVPDLPIPVKGILDGSLKDIPHQWDFPQTGTDYALPEIRIDSWGGCLLVNPDPDCGR